MIRYYRVNQCRIFNPKKERIDVSASVQFFESFSFYNTSHGLTNEDNNNCAEKIDVWNETNVDEFGKVMTREREWSTVADIEEKKNNDSLLGSDVDNNHLLSNQPITSSIVSSDTFSPLIDISGGNILLPADLFLNLHEKEDFQSHQIHYKVEIVRIKLQTHVCHKENLESSNAFIIRIPENQTKIYRFFSHIKFFTISEYLNPILTWFEY